jgi:DNA sulfur modification protein DndB
MGFVLPAMRGKFGSTEFFLVTMHAKELAERLVIPKEMDGWEDLTIEERFQRDVNFARVKTHIAPYVAHDPDRFFGAFIVAMKNDDEVTFEQLGEMGSRFPALYKTAGQAFGFLTFSGAEVLVPLDGQHRLAAIKFAISGKDQTGKPIEGLTPNVEAARDACTVMLIRYDAIKARKIFNKVNRYAKATSKADNLVTADDDIVAVITREEVARNVIDERVVNYESNTLSAKAHEFTTLSTLYEATALVLEETMGKRIDRTSLPDVPQQVLYRNEARDFWKSLCEGVTVFEMALHDPSEAGDEKRREIRKDYLLGKPIAQLALVDAVLRLRHEGESGSRMPMPEAMKRVNAVDWRSSNPLWQGVLMSGSKVVTGKQAAKFAARFLEYYLGGRLDDKEVDVLTEQYQNHSGNAGRSLPDPIFRPGSA